MSLKSAEVQSQTKRVEAEHVDAINSLKFIFTVHVYRVLSFLKATLIA